jgi:plastocyanin
MTTKKLFLPSLVAAAALSLGAATGASAADQKVIKVKDGCDPATFNAALGEGACVRDGGGSRVEFEDLIAHLQKKGSDWHWRFSDKKVRIDAGESLRIVFDKGGEGHTFTEVPRFGPGCVPEINDLIGAVGAPVSDCSEAIEPTYVGPGRDAFEISGLAGGTHYFECLIHPWMQTTVVVR